MHFSDSQLGAPTIPLHGVVPNITVSHFNMETSTPPVSSPTHNFIEFVEYPEVQIQNHLLQIRAPNVPIIDAKIPLSFTPVQQTTPLEFESHGDIMKCYISTIVTHGYEGDEECWLVVDNQSDQKTTYVPATVENVNSPFSMIVSWKDCFFVRNITHLYFVHKGVKTVASLMNRRMYLKNYVFEPVNGGTSIAAFDTNNNRDPSVVVMCPRYHPHTFYARIPGWNYSSPDLLVSYLRTAFKTKWVLTNQKITITKNSKSVDIALPDGQYHPKQLVATLNTWLLPVNVRINLDYDIGIYTLRSIDANMTCEITDDLANALGMPTQHKENSQSLASTTPVYYCGYNPNTKGYTVPTNSYTVNWNAEAQSISIDAKNPLGFTVAFTISKTPLSTLLNLAKIAPTPGHPWSPTYRTPNSVFSLVTIPEYLKCYIRINDTQTNDDVFGPQFLLKVHPDSDHNTSCSNTKYEMVGMSTFALTPYRPGQNNLVFDVRYMNNVIYYTGHSKITYHVFY